MMERMKQWGAVSLLSMMLCFGCTIPCAYADVDALEVRCAGSDDERIVAGSELFSHVDNGLPGDVFVGSLNIVNESDEEREVFLHTQDVVTDGPDDMLGRIPFTVQAGGEAVFEGALADAESAEPISVGMLGAGEVASVDCMAVIPSELTSEYADAAVGMNVAVGMRARDEVIGSGGGEGSGNSNGGSNPLVPTGANQGASLVQAGDILATMPFVLGVLAAAGTVIWCAWKRRMRMW